MNLYRYENTKKHLHQW